MTILDRVPMPVAIALWCVLIVKLAVLSVTP